MRLLRVLGALSALASLLIAIRIGSGVELMVLLPAVAGAAAFAFSCRHSLHYVEGRQAGVDGLVRMAGGQAVSAAAAGLVFEGAAAIGLLLLAIVSAGLTLRARRIVRRVRRPLFDGYAID